MSKQTDDLHFRGAEHVCISAAHLQRLTSEEEQANFSEIMKGTPSIAERQKQQKDSFQSMLSKQ